MEEFQNIPPEVLDQLLDGISQASPWSQSVFGLIILILMIGVGLFIRLFIREQRQKETMAKEYLEASKMMVTLKLRMEDSIQKMDAVEDMIKEGKKTQEAQQKAIEMLDGAINELRGVSNDLSKIVWKNEDT